MSAYNYTGRNIFVYDAKGACIVKTTVKSHNREYMIVSLQGTWSNLDTQAFFSVIILGEDGVHEYQGKIKHTSQALITDIALSKGKVVENRSTRRYAINTPAMVEALVFGEEVAPMLNALQVQATNVSTTGILLRAQPNSFCLGAVLEFTLGDDGAPALRGRVVRVREVSSATQTEYGCTLIVK